MSKTGLSREAERHKPLTATDRLRQLLIDLENQLGALGRSSAEEALTLPAMLSEATALLETAKAKGALIQAEEVRLATILAQFERKADTFMRTVGQQRLEAARPEPVPEEAWWWHADQIVADQQRARRNRALRMFGIVALVVILVVVGYRLFLAPDPSVIERLNHINNAELLADENRYEEAIAAIQLAQTAVPDDSFTLLMEGAYHELLGETEAADRLFSQAKNLTESEVDFLSQRAQVYLRMDEAEIAMEDLDTILERDPESVIAHYLKASAQERLNLLDQAYENYVKAAELADEAGNSQMSGMARVQLAYLTQRMMSGGASEQVLTPTP
ncbi:MAG: hypothetical protein JXN59_07705 [Anaerolineae bacterium]|nr:hypothetical protein [Anaerolineae bacterium]